MGQSLVIISLMLATFLSAYAFFPALKSELTPANYPSDRVLGRSALLGLAAASVAVIASVVASAASTTTSAPGNIPSITYTQVMTVVIISPIIEELLVRGILTESVRFLCEKMRAGSKSAVIAEVVAAVAFVSLHIPSSTNVVLTVFTVGILAVLLGELRRRHGVIASIVAHVVYNFATVVVAVYFTLGASA